MMSNESQKGGAMSNAQWYTVLIAVSAGLIALAWWAA
jgi:hypothetical protein